MSDADSGRLDVELINAYGLDNTALFGKMDPYVILTYGTQEQKSTVSECAIADAAGKMGARWNEKFKFTASKDTSELTIKFMNKNLITQDTFLGQANIAIWPLLERRINLHLARTYDLDPVRTYDVIKDEKNCGKLNVKLKFTSEELLTYLSD